MAALTAGLLASVAAGRPHVAAVRPLYGTSDHLLGSGLLGTEVGWAEPDKVAASIRPDTGLVIVESPANPTLTEVDLRALAEACGEVPLRVETAARTAAELAERLARHPGVARVHYPGRAAQRPGGQMTGGGAVLAFEPTGDPHAVSAAVRLLTPAVSLGSVDTLIQHPGSLSHRILDPADRAAAGIGDQLLRVSIGLEDVEDLWADLEGALGAAM